MRTLALVLEYDGRGFAGSQVQRNSRTVQGEVEDAVERLTGERRRLRLAGRTDSGVHALGQVAAFEMEADFEPETVAAALNAHLPPDLAVKRAWVAPPGFDPRRRAVSRVYRYLLLNERARSPLWAGRAWRVPGALDEVAMAACLPALLGERDFASFSPGLPEGRSTVRRMLRAELLRSGAFVSLEFEANAFLPHQVRRTVGALVEVGRGRLNPQVFRGFLERPAHNSAGPAAPPEGLYLVAVRYPADGENSEDLLGEGLRAVQGLARP